MDFLYLPKLIINNIDSVIISLITGTATSIFVSRIFLIKQNEDEKMRRLKPRIEVLSTLGVVFRIISHAAQEITEERFNKFIYWYSKQISDTLEEESKQFLYMNFEDLDEQLHSISVQHNDLIEEINNCMCKKPDKINIDKIKEWSNGIYSIKTKYDNYFAKTSKSVLLKNILLDKFIMSIYILILILLVIA